MLATVYAKHELLKDSIRTVSVGFRPKKEVYDDINGVKMSPYEWIKRIDQILFDSKSTSNHYFCDRMLDSSPNNYYVRFETTSDIKSYDATK